MFLADDRTEVQQCEVVSPSLGTTIGKHPIRELASLTLTGRELVREHPLVDLYHVPFKYRELVIKEAGRASAVTSSQAPAFL